jgi:hypothetical protein
MSHDAHDKSADAATRTPQLWGLMAQFTDARSLLEAARQVRDAGFRRWDCFSPFAVHGLDAAMGQRPTRLPWLVFLGGLSGALTGLLLQWWTAATTFAGVPTELQGYMHITSGKPFFSLPANIPVIFELTILFSALTAVFGMIMLNRLPCLYHPLFKRPSFRRATQDRFFIVIEADDPRFDKQETEALLQRIKATSVEAVED